MISIPPFTVESVPPFTVESVYFKPLVLKYDQRSDGIYSEFSSKIKLKALKNGSQTLHSYEDHKNLHTTLTHWLSVHIPPEELKNYYGSHNESLKPKNENRDNHLEYKEFDQKILKEDLSSLMVDSIFIESKFYDGDEDVTFSLDVENSQTRNEKYMDIVFELAEYKKKSTENEVKMTNVLNDNNSVTKNQQRQCDEYKKKSIEDEVRMRKVFKYKKSLTKNQGVFQRQFDEYKTKSIEDELKMKKVLNEKNSVLEDQQAWQRLCDEYRKKNTGYLIAIKELENIKNQLEKNQEAVQIKCNDHVNKKNITHWRNMYQTEMNKKQLVVQEQGNECKKKMDKILHDKKVEIKYQNIDDQYKADPSNHLPVDPSILDTHYNKVALDTLDKEEGFLDERNLTKIKKVEQADCNKKI